jgi:hypothetical protein
MAANNDIKSLETPEQMEFQRRSWVAQRVGWVVFMFILIAAVLGVFGGAGPLASVSTGDENSPIRVDYKRFIRFLEPTQFQIQVRPQASDGDRVRVWINRPYLDKFVIQSITPQPEGQEAAADRVIYEFKLSEAGQPFQITFEIRHTQPGFLYAEIGLEDGSAIDFTQLIYP